MTNGSLSVSLLRAGEPSARPPSTTTRRSSPPSSPPAPPAGSCFSLRETLDRLLGEEPPLRRNYLRYLTGRVRFLSGRLRSVAQTGAGGSWPGIC